MRVVILQPGYLPWLGFFDQLKKADCFVIYDDVQYTRRDWRNRNYIKTPTGSHPLIVPVLNHGRTHQLIKEAEIDYTQHWVNKHLKAILNSYKHAPFFENYYPKLAEILNSKHRFLVDLDVEIIQFCAKWLGINTPMLFSSKINIPGKSTERLVNICQNLKATKYLTGDAASSYIDESMFIQAGIALEFHGYKHPVYKQINGSFVSHLSIIDLLFNHGDDSLAILSRENF